MKKFYLLFLFCLIVVTGFSQHQGNGKSKKALLYDDWPVTVESNANRNRSSTGDITVNFVPIGTTWDHRTITYFFENGTDDIVGND